MQNFPLLFYVYFKSIFPFHYLISIALKKKKKEVRENKQSLSRL